jgi:hypothetical protein
MSKYEKILIVILMGSLWGALELFGADILRASGVANKSALLFGASLILLYASKRIVDFAGSVVLMAIIAGLFKTASSNFFPCQMAAVMINGIVFDTTYRIFKNRLNSSLVYRVVAAGVIAYVSFTAFGFTALYLLRESTWVAGGLKGIGDYVGSRALVATLFSAVTINLGYYLGGFLRPHFLSGKPGLTVTFIRIATAILVIAIWAVGQIY